MQLNLNRRSHRKVVVGACEEFLNILPMKNYLSYEEMSKDRVNVEQIDKDIDFV